MVREIEEDPNGKPMDFEEPSPEIAEFDEHGRLVDAFSTDPTEAAAMRAAEGVLATTAPFGKAEVSQGEEACAEADAPEHDAPDATAEAAADRAKPAGEALVPEGPPEGDGPPDCWPPLGGPYTRYTMDGLIPPWVDLESFWKVIYQRSSRPCCWAYTAPPPSGERFRKIFQGDVIGPILEVGQFWVWEPEWRGRAGFWRGFVTACVRGPADGLPFEYVNLWGTRTPRGTLTACWFAEPIHTLPAPAPGLGQGLQGPPPAGEGGPPPPGEQVSFFLEDCGGVHDLPPDNEWEHLDGMPLPAPSETSPEKDWLEYERYCVWKMMRGGMKPMDCSYCGRRNVWFGSNNCVGIPCLKLRREQAEERAHRPLGEQRPNPPKRRRTGDQTKRQAWFGQRAAVSRAVDVMAVGPDQRDRAQRNLEAAEAYASLNARRARSKPAQQMQAPTHADEADAEDEHWGDWGPAPKGRRPKTPPRRPKTPPRAPKKPAPKKAPQAKPGTSIRPPGMPPMMAPPTGKQGTKRRAPETAPKDNAAPKAKADKKPRPPPHPPPQKAAPDKKPKPPQHPPPQPPPPPKAAPRPGAARSQAAGKQRTEQEKAELLAERRMELLRLACENKEKMDQKRALDHMIQELQAQVVAKVAEVAENQAALDETLKQQEMAQENLALIQASATDAEEQRTQAQKQQAEDLTVLEEKQTQTMVYLQEMEAARMEAESKVIEAQAQLRIVQEDLAAAQMQQHSHTQLQQSPDLWQQQQDHFAWHQHQQAHTPVQGQAGGSSGSGAMSPDDFQAVQQVMQSPQQPPTPQHIQPPQQPPLQPPSLQQPPFQQQALQPPTLQQQPFPRPPLHQQPPQVQPPAPLQPAPMQEPHPQQQQPPQMQAPQPQQQQRYSNAEWEAWSWQLHGAYQAQQQESQRQREETRKLQQRLDELQRQHQLQAQQAPPQAPQAPQALQPPQAPQLPQAQQLPQMPPDYVPAAAAVVDMIRTMMLHMRTPTTGGAQPPARQ